MSDYEEGKVLCGSSCYEKKYYFNSEFSALPQEIQDELHIMCVLFTEEVGGVLTLQYDEAGNLQFVVSADEGDLLFDEIGSHLKIKQIRQKKQELLESLELFYKVFYLGMELEEDSGDTAGSGEDDAESSGEAKPEVGICDGESSDPEKKNSGESV